MVQRRIMAALAALLLVGILTPAASAHRVQERIALPTGFQPEGIAIKGSNVYTGSVATGAIWKGSLRSGQGDLLVAAQAGRKATGMKVDRWGRLWVSGADTGHAYVYDAKTGEGLADYQLAPGAPTFINDVVVTRGAVWFTDSNRPVLYRLPLGAHGALPAQADVTEVALSGDYVHGEGFNLNGIDATRNGKSLLAVQSNTGQLFRIDAATGAADRIELAGGDVANGDGILLQGRTLYVVQNQDNQIAVVKLDRGLGAGTIVAHLTNADDFDVPTTIARKGGVLYAVNARFGNPTPDTADYWIASVRLPGHGHGHGGGGCGR